jgi:hypothetical protein
MGKYTTFAELETLAYQAVHHVDGIHHEPRPTMPNGFAILQDNGAPSTWLVEWRKFETFLDTGIPQWPIFMEDGNGKLPFLAFSTLPKLTCPGAGDCLAWCYSFKSWRYAKPFFRQLQNTILLLSDKGQMEIVKAFYDVPDGRDFRLYVDGDFDSLNTMHFWFDLLESRPNVPTYGYSKSWELFLEWDDIGNTFPTNYVLNTSGGSKYDGNMLERVKALNITRGDFLALPVNRKMPDIKADRPDFNAWAKDLRATAKTMGMGRVWVCPGKCGNCTPNGHACGSRKFQNIPVVIGLH